MKKRNPKTYSKYLGRLFEDEQYEYAAAELERYKRKYPEWNHRLEKYKGRSPDIPKTLWHLQIWHEEDV